MAVGVERAPCIVLTFVVALPIQMRERRVAGCYVQATTRSAYRRRLNTSKDKATNAISVSVSCWVGTTLSSFDYSELL